MAQAYLLAAQAKGEDEAMPGGWIKLHRCLLDKSIWKLNDAQRIVFITILMMANHDEKQWIWQGEQFKAKPGQFVTSSGSLAKAAKVSRQSVRTALVNLKKLDFLTYESTKTGMLITVINWALYQSRQNESTNSSTIDQPSVNHYQEGKNDKKSLPAKKITIVNIYHDLFLDRYKSKPVIGGKVAQILQGISKEIGPEDAERRLRLFFQDENEFVTKSKHAAEMFRARINQYVATAEKVVMLE